MRLALALICCCSCRPTWESSVEIAESAASEPLSLSVLGVQRHEVERTVLGWLSRALRRPFFPRYDSMRLRVTNGSADPIYVYRDVISVRRRTLELREHAWHDRRSSADCHWSDPRYLRIEPNHAVTWSLTMSPAALTASTIEVAWSDWPLVARSDGCTEGRAQELTALERGILSAVVR